MTGHDITTMYEIWLLSNENAFTASDLDTLYSCTRNVLQSCEKQRSVMLTSYRLINFDMPY